MSKYNVLRAEFIDKHKNCDEFFYLDDGSNTPVKAIYYAPDPNSDYEGLDKLLAEINGEDIDESPIDKVISAFINKGNHPEYHDIQVRYLETHWPSLYFAIKELAKKESK